MTNRVVHISDLHYETVPERLMPGVRQSLNASLSLIQELRCDLVVASGDLTSYGCFDRRQLMGVQTWLGRLGAPVLAIPGNHDLSANPARGASYPIMETYEPVAWEHTNFARTFLGPPLVRHQLGALTLIGIALRDGDPDGVLTQLSEQLSALDGPALVIGHYPLVITKDAGILQTFGYEGYIDQVHERLLDLIVNQPRVRAYLCGHVHAQTVTAITDSLYQLTAGGLGPGASAGWIIDIESDHLEIRSLRGAGPATFWPDSYIGGGDPLDYHLWCGSEPIVLTLDH